MCAGALLQHARGRLRELPAAGLGYPVGPYREVLPARDKVLTLLPEISGESILDTATSPEDGKALRQQREDITPGYHINAQHWITSYPAAKQQKLPRAKRPVDPATFAKSQW